MKIGKNTIRVMAGLMASVLAAGAQAQSPGGSCAHTRANPVRARVEVIGGVPCGGSSIAIAGIEMKTDQIGCPLMVVSWPPYHEEVDAGSAETETATRGMLAPKLAYFECVRHTFLLIPIGSSCELRRVADGAAFADLKTIGCGSAAQTGE